jgi:hypothetical protein
MSPVGPQGMIRFSESILYARDCRSDSRDPTASAARFRRAGKDVAERVEG